MNRNFPFWLMGLILFSHGLLAMDFVPNAGQWDKEMDFCISTDEGTIWVNGNSIVFDVYDNLGFHDAIAADKEDVQIRAHGWSMNFENSREVEPEILIAGKTLYHYFVGNNPDRWKSNVQCAKRIRYTGLYEGIDLEIYSDNGLFKYDFVVHPGADPSVIRWHYEGIQPTLTKGGELEFKCAWKSFFEEAPYSYQEFGSSKQTINSSYSGNPENGYSFELGGYDPNQELIIDPGVLFSTFFHGSAIGDGGLAHPDGGVVHFINSGESFGSTGAYVSLLNSNLHIAKYNHNLSELEWVAQIGGSNPDFPFDFDFSEVGLIVSGITQSQDFPMFPDSFSDTYEGGSRAIFAFVLSLDGSDYLAATYLASGSYMSAEGLSLTASFNSFSQPGTVGGYSHTALEHNGEEIFISFSARSGSNFEDANYLGSENQSYTNIYVMSLDNALTTLNWCNVLSADGEAEIAEDFLPVDSVFDLELLSNGNLLLVGCSNAPGLPVTEGTVQAEYTGKFDGWMGVFEPDDGALLHSTYFGSSENDDVQLAASEDEDSFLVIGRSSGELPLSEGALNTGSGKLWIARFSNDLSTLENLARIGETEPLDADLIPTAFELNRCGDICFSITSGFSVSDSDQHGLKSFPITSGLDQVEGSYYVSSLGNHLDQLLYGQYLGGTHGLRTTISVDGRFFHGICLHQSALPQYQVFATPGVHCSEHLFNIQPNISLVQIGRPFLSTELEVEPGANCLPFQLDFSAQGSAEAYEWDFGDGQTLSGNAVQNHSYQEPGEYQLRLISTDTASCNIKDTLFYTVLVPEPRPLPLADFELGNFDPCSLPSQLSASFSGVQGTTLEWSFSDANPEFNAQEVEYILSSPGEYSLSLLVSDSICGRSDSLSQVITVFEPLSLELLASETDPCLISQELQLAINVQGEESITWTLDSGSQLSNQESIQYTLTAPGSYSFTVLANDEDCNVNEELSYSIDLSGPLQASWEYTLPDSCAGNQPVLASFTGSGADQLQWTLPDGTTLNNESSIEVFPNGYGPQPLQLLARSALCGQDSLFSVYYNEHEPLDVSASLVLEGENPCSGITVTASLSGSGYDTILWEDDLGNSSNQSEITLQYPPGTTTSLRIEVMNSPCQTSYSNTFDIDVPAGTELREINIPNVFSPQRDGINDVFYIPQLSQAQEEIELHFRVFNRWGNLVFEQRNAPVSWDGTQQGEPVEEGVYSFTLDLKSSCTEETIQHSGMIHIVR